VESQINNVSIDVFLVHKQKGDAMAVNNVSIDVLLVRQQKRDAMAVNNVSTDVFLVRQQKRDAQLNNAPIGVSLPNQNLFVIRLTPYGIQRQELACKRLPQHQQPVRK
jgi:hypothetical protein